MRVYGQQMQRLSQQIQRLSQQIRILCRRREGCVSRCEDYVVDAKVKSVVAKTTVQYVEDAKAMSVDKKRDQWMNDEKGKSIDENVISVDDKIKSMDEKVA